MTGPRRRETKALLDFGDARGLSGAMPPSRNKMGARGIAFVAMGLLAASAAILYPIWKASQAPQLLFVMNGKPVDLSPQAQARIIGQMESIIRSVDATSDLNPERFKGSFYEISPKELKENGSYFQVAYPHEKTFSTPAGLIKAKDFYIGILDYANLPGWPGGIFLVAADNHITNISCKGNLTDALESLARASRIVLSFMASPRSSIGSASNGKVCSRSEKIRCTIR